MTGLLTELGPSKFPDPDGLPRHNPYSWNNNASVIFLDQPVNTGFSYSGTNVGTSTGSAKDIYSMLTLFFNQYPQYSNQSFHISGESYGGHYIPAAAHEILSHEDRNINLKSIMVGNGLTDPLTQYKYYRPMACGEGGYPAVLTDQQCKDMDTALPRCEQMIQKCYETVGDQTCADAESYCNQFVLDKIYAGHRDPYNIRRTGAEAPKNYIDNFISSNHTLSVLGVKPGLTYEMCNGTVHLAFDKTGDWMKPLQRAVPETLTKIPVLVYAGDADYMCNWLGNRAWTEALEWPGKKAYNDATVQPLKLGGAGKEYGNIKNSGNFTFMRIFQAGHMVPSDQPETALDFANRWLAGEWWNECVY